MQGKSAARQDARQALPFGPGSEGEQGAAMDGVLGCSSPDLATPSAPRPPVRSSLLPSATIPAHCCDKQAYPILGRACMLQGAHHEAAMPMQGAHEGWRNANEGKRLRV